ncbi:MAG: 2-C-methyl-D-erythritol 4-phosphate cytidylyltransferase [Treponema sp.]|nr:2-C-methyl-D-erythritol 4-phosphate cytidylyltransferase [Treponema sp.]
MNCVLLKMGGSGVRFGASVPKQFYEINGEPLFAYVLRKYETIKCIDKFIIVTNSEWGEITNLYATKILGKKLLGIVSGGKTNIESTYNGVMYAAKFLTDSDYLLVHDVTDPIINEKAIREVITAAQKDGCAAVVTEQVHTLYTKNAEGYITGTIKKDCVGSGYSPEAFQYSIIKDCFNKAKDGDFFIKTSAMEVVQSKGIHPKVVVSHQVDLKITYQEDMEALLLMIENGERLYN